jgi:hypothetical protein
VHAKPAPTATLRKRQETLCIAPQNVVEYWEVATWPVEKNGLGMDLATVTKKVADLRQLFTLLPYTSQVLETWQRIVIAQGVLGKQVHDAHLVAMMQVHSIMSILTFIVAMLSLFPALLTNCGHRRCLSHVVTEGSVQPASLGEQFVQDSNLDVSGDCSPPSNSPKCFRAYNYD